MLKVIIASKNQGKIREIREILGLEGMEILDLIDLSYSEKIEETGETFLENALIKAERVFNRYRIPVIADDSGLQVKCLNGKPGINSARFSGSKATDESNNLLLLEKMSDLPNEERDAQFICVAVFYYDFGRYCVAEGIVRGSIAHSPAGDTGFGYDPLFIIPELGKTMGELSDDEKNRVSHRALAFRKLKKYIEDYMLFY